MLLQTVLLVLARTSLLLAAVPGVQLVVQLQRTCGVDTDAQQVAWLHAAPSICAVCVSYYTNRRPSMIYTHVPPDTSSQHALHRILTQYTPFCGRVMLSSIRAYTRAQSSLKMATLVSPVLYVNIAKSLMHSWLCSQADCMCWTRVHVLDTPALPMLSFHPDMLFLI